MFVILKNHKWSFLPVSGELKSTESLFELPSQPAHFFLQLSEATSHFSNSPEVVFAKKCETENLLIS